MQYINIYNTEEAYNLAPRQNFDVSWIRDIDKVQYFKKLILPELTYLVSDIATPTKLLGGDLSTVEFMSIDGTMITPTKDYQFNSIGEHKVGIKFKDNTTGLEGIFRECSTLIGVPEDLLWNLTKVTDCRAMFSKCVLLKRVPEKLFMYNLLITHLGNCFSYSGLEEIPAKLFMYNVNIIDFFMTFIETKITSIPKDLFRYNVKVFQFLGTFSECRDLSIVPSDMLKYNKQVTEFRSLFQNTAISSTPNDPEELWLRLGKPGYPPKPEPPSGKPDGSGYPGKDCFRGCNNIPKNVYNSIPSDWRGPDRV